ncbi:MAG: hypothetical protein WKG07_15955 [Hymenobacter sp.]
MRDLPRPLSAPLLSQTDLMNPYLIKDFWKKCGCVDATTLNFETMMYYQEHNLMLYPEGVPGIGKGFNRKYELQRLATSMLRLSLQHGTDIVPFYTINAEYLNPYAYSFEWINRLTQKIGIPFLPITLLLLLSNRAALGVLPGPARPAYLRDGHPHPAPPTSPPKSTTS